MINKTRATLTFFTSGSSSCSSNESNIDSSNVHSVFDLLKKVGTLIHHFVFSRLSIDTPSVHCLCFIHDPQPDLHFLSTTGTKLPNYIFWSKRIIVFWIQKCLSVNCFHVICHPNINWDDGHCDIRLTSPDMAVYFLERVETKRYGSTVGAL